MKENGKLWEPAYMMVSFDLSSFFFVCGSGAYEMIPCPFWFKLFKRDKIQNNNTKNIINPHKKSKKGAQYNNHHLSYII